MSDKFVDKQTGEEVLKSPIESSAGAGDAHKIPATKGDGTLDSTFFPSGTVNRITADASEDLTVAGTVGGVAVNVWNDSGTTKVRLADATDNSKPADGFVTASVTTGNPAEVIPFNSIITGWTGLTPDVVYFLSTTPGEITVTAPSTSGNIIQPVGFTDGTTILNASPSRTNLTVIQ